MRVRERRAEKLATLGCLCLRLFGRRLLGLRSLSVLFIPYLMPARDLQIAQFPCHDTLNSVSTYLIGV